MDERPLALYRRFLWEPRNISWVYTSGVEKLFASRRNYFESCGMAQHMLTDAQQHALDDLTVAATLASESQVERESWGWTVRIPLKPWGLFCAAEPEGSVCARFSQLPDGAASDPVGLFSVQRVADDSPVRQSSLIPRDVTPHLLVEQYFDESEQIPARIAISGQEALMALSMPNAEWDIVSGLSETDLFSLFHELLREDGVVQVPEAEGLSDKAREIKSLFAAAKGEPIGGMVGDLKLMHEAVFYYGCRCNIQQIRRMVENLPEPQKSDLWQDSRTIEVQCPRCGRTHILTR